MLPDKILRVNNEDVIEDLEGQVRRAGILRITFGRAVHFLS